MVTSTRMSPNSLPTRVSPHILVPRHPFPCNISAPRAGILRMNVEDIHAITRRLLGGGACSGPTSWTSLTVMPRGYLLAYE